MKNLRLKAFSKGAVATVAVMAYFILLFSYLGKYNFALIEHTTTLYYDGAELLLTLNTPGGLSQIVSDFLIQFFVNPWAGIVISALVLTVISVLTARLIRVIYGNNLFAPLGLLPASVLAILHYNMNYHYAGTVAFLFMLIALNGFFHGSGKLMFSNIRNQILYTLLCAVTLYVIGGAVATLYAITMVVIAVFRNPRQSAYYLLLPLVVVILGYVTVRSGKVGDQLHTLLPAAYFTHRLPAPQIVNLPWTTFGIVIVVSCLFSLYRMRSLWLRRTVQGIAILSVAVTTSVLTLNVNRDTEMFKQLNCLIRQGDWHAIADEPASVHNLLLQNCRNMALAELSRLGDDLFRQPCVDIRNIYITGDSNPYMYMLLSDIYQSMGHLALAQRHAFEANESFYNKSPRMLQRLVDTNIAYGNYKVAEKYISKLEKTLYYKEWARQRRSLLSDDSVAADKYMSQLRACVFSDNRFSATKGLDKDLWEVLRANPQHTATAQYLGSLYLLTKDLDQFSAFVDEFMAAGVLQQPLPQAFQEGIITMGATSANPDSVYAHYGIESRNVDRYKAFKESSASSRDNFWHFYYYQR